MLATILFFQTVPADIIITPDAHSFSGNVGSVIQGTFLLNNTGNTTVNGTISSETSGLDVYPVSYSLGENETLSVSVYYTLPFTASSGTITYIWSGTNITFKATAVEETSDIEIYPANPKAGASLAVILKGKYEGKDAKGLLYCNNNLYAFDMSNGVGVVALDQHFYGTATLRIFSGDFSPTEITKTIIIEQPSTDNIRLLASSTGTINKETTVVLRFNQKPLSDFEVKVTGPDGTDSYLITDENGKIYPILDKAGIWSFNANVYGRDLVAMTSAVYETLLLSFTGTPSVGAETIINTEPYASVEIFLEGELIGQYVASPQGTVEFTPIVGGFYEVQGTSSSKKGTCYFDVIGTATIRLVDALTTRPAINFEKGKMYQIIVSNNAGITLENIEMLYITTPFATTEILSLIGGKATWMPHLTGSYVFAVEETDTQTGASQYIVVREALVEGIDVVIPIIVAVSLIFAIIIIVIIYYAHHNKIPLKNIFKNIKFGKKKVSLPFD